MNFKITGELINLKDLETIYIDQNIDCTYTEKKHEIILKIENEAARSEVLEICADVLGIAVFFQHINHFIETEQNIPDHFPLILKREIGASATVEYIRILTFKTLLDFVGDDDHINIDSVSNFRLSKLKDEAELFIQNILRQCQFEETLTSINSQESTVDALKQKIESVMDQGIDLVMFMPIFQSIYKTLNPEGHKLLTLGKKDDYFLLDYNNQPLFIDNILSSIHPNLELEPLALDTLKKFVNDTALLIQIILPQKVVVKKENFEESEIRLIQILLTELPKIIGNLEVQFI